MYTLNTYFCVTRFLIQYYCCDFFFDGICISFNMHSSRCKVRRQDVLWLVGPVGPAMKHRPVSAGMLGDQTHPVRPLRWRVVDASSGRLPGKLQAADEKEEQHSAFSETGRRVRTQCPNWCKQICSAFRKIFFVILAKFLVIIDIIFLFKIRSQYTWFSLFWLCTECKKVNL